MPGLDNPFLNKTNPLYQPLPIPNKGNVANMQVISNNPLYQSLPTPNLNRGLHDANPRLRNPNSPPPRPKDPYYNPNNATAQVNPFAPKEMKPETPLKSEGWWKKRTKTQKILIVGSSVLGLAVIGFAIYSSSKSKK
jgi:hypothetical protein